MRIGLEVRALHRSYRGSGQWRYAHNLLREIAQLEAGHEFHLVSPYPRDELDFPAMPSAFRYTYWMVRMPRHTRRAWLWEQTVLPIFLRLRGLTVFHFLLQMATWWAPCKLVVTVYDLMHELFPEYSHVRASRNYRLQRRAIRNADQLLAISDNTKSDLVRLYQVDPRRISLVPLAADPVFCPKTGAADLDTIRVKHHLPPRFILSVLSYEPRKNTVGVIGSFAEFVSATGLPHHLVLFGDRGSGMAPESIEGAIIRAGMTDRVHLVGQLPDDELATLYNLAEFFVFGSFFEGFGLPVLEAMACGKAVIAANGSAIPEIVGDAGLLIDVTNARALVGAVARLATDVDLRHAMEERALARAALFSWEQSARRVVEVYRRLGAPNSHRPLPDATALATRG